VKKSPLLCKACGNAEAPDTSFSQTVFAFFAVAVKFKIAENGVLALDIFLKAGIMTAISR
jgi:hypothetical protein